MTTSTTPQFVEEYYKALDEHIVSATLDNGLSVRFIPRKGFRSGKAMLSARVGSIDMAWTNAQGKKGQAPAGIAHYLEHQLFKKGDADLSDSFSELGAYVNAHTSHTSTSYYTDFVSHRNDNLNLLFRLFFEEYFDQDLVDTERDIIIQEIRLYRDRPYWVAYGALLSSLYSRHTIRFDIAGDEESVEKIGPATLLKTHRAFYAPSNACLTLSGDWESAEILDCVAELNAKLAPQKWVATSQPFDWQEPTEVNRSEAEITMTTPEERYLLGFKLAPLANVRDSLRQEMLGNLALQLAFGAGTPFLEDVYNRGVVTGDFASGLHIERSFAYGSIGGRCREIPELEGAIEARTAEVLKKGFSKASLDRKLRQIRGKSLRRFDSVSSTVDVHAEAWLSDISPFESLAILDEITVSDVQASFKEMMVDAPRSRVVLRRR